MNNLVQIEPSLKKKHEKNRRYDRFEEDDQILIAYELILPRINIPGGVCIAIFHLYDGHDEQQTSNTDRHNHVTRIDVLFVLHVMGRLYKGNLRLV